MSFLFAAGNTTGNTRGRNSINMNDFMQEAVNHDKALNRAMVDQDLETLERMLNDDVTLVNHLGRRKGKEDILEFFRERRYELDSIDASLLWVHPMQERNAAVTSSDVTVHWRSGVLQKDRMVFNRVWEIREGQWRLVSASDIQILH